ncbi:cupredoxin domain-containing protein [Haloechinothrix sp. LS1_15]|uniref:cupredoxin domain-containing protein n=1 Tax=Haloechinothrix sp. LS1_15 TaxID=2652248 RepID=UPI002946089D|nr:cupredoxin domain-containing protein [Haloechinothrix sp. LS1_15]MDV6011381.1 plastocyanin [Haloechinothrix sp. LS1_15]
MIRTRTTATAAIAAALALAACAPAEEDNDRQTAQTPERPTEESPQRDDDTDEPASPPPDGAEETVEIVDFQFEADDLAVPVGTTVTWIQRDESLHTVDFDDGEESGDLEAGESYSRTFDEPGEYPYDCFYHPRMTATVTVTVTE